MNLWVINRVENTLITRGDNVNSIDGKAINTIRFLAVDAVDKANSGHPGLPMGAASMAYVLWKDFLKISAKNPEWIDRDRFVLSAGHGSMLLYSLLHLFGFGIGIEDIKNFRQLDSITPGHPEYGHTPGVETTTGPLGQGFANAVGMAIAERKLAAEFNTPEHKIIDHYTYILAGDGDLMEGISAEAASLAGHLGLGKIVCLYDNNHITIDGSTKNTFTEDVELRFKAYGWHVQKVEDGNDLASLQEALGDARAEAYRPSLIMVTNVIGYGSPNMAGKAEVHGAPLGKEETRLTKINMGWDEQSEFLVPDEVYEYMDKISEQKNSVKKAWDCLLGNYKAAYPEKHKKLIEWFESEHSLEWLLSDERITRDYSSEATRILGGDVLNIARERMGNLIGGSADLNSSTKTYIKGSEIFERDCHEGDNIYYGVREHAMAGITNGIALHGGYRAFCSTFMVFSDYMKPSIRLAALMKIPSIFVFTHDSIGVGEDGPTHQPIEHVMNLRSIPNLSVYRPMNLMETALAWKKALERCDGPSAIILTRQKIRDIRPYSSDMDKGAYIVIKEDKEIPDAIIMGSGSEVQLLEEARTILLKDGIDCRVVSFLCFEDFEAQSAEYKKEVLPPDIKVRVSLEAGITMGWDRYTGDFGITIGIDCFGASAPGDILMKKYGMTALNVVSAVKESMKRTL